jgi:DNA polymerase III alpha subunit
MLNNVNIDWDEIDLEDKNVWSLFAEGKTKGLFQLESNLGKSWSKKLQPENIEQLSALVAILRPGALKAIIEDEHGKKSITQRYVDRRHGREPVTYIHESCQDILKPTLGLMLYQEQTMKMAVRIAGFTGVEADKLRKAIGKKKADLMAEIRKWFIEGCDKTGIVTGEKANEIYDIIEKSARYQFNKSHSVSYAMTAYWTAYAKYYYPKNFFISYLEFSHEKPVPHEEVSQLVSEAKLFDFKVKTPKIINFTKSFSSEDGSNNIYFGIKNIKSLTGVNGDKTIQALNSTREELNKDFKDFTWMDILIKLSPKLNSTNFKTLASIGFFRGISTIISRNKALYEYESLKTLTDSEFKWITANYEKYKWKTLSDCLKDASNLKKEGGATSRETRKQALLDEIKMLNNPPYSLDDDPSWVIDQEVKYLGCPVSLSRIESVDSLGANVTCKEILDITSKEGVRVAANIVRVNDFTIKKEGPNKGKIMSFLTIEDDSCSFDNSVIFPDSREANKFKLFSGNNVMIYGKIEKGSLIIDKLEELQ